MNATSESTCCCSLRCAPDDAEEKATSRVLLNHFWLRSIHAAVFGHANAIVFVCDAWRDSKSDLSILFRSNISAAEFEVIPFHAAAADENGISSKWQTSEKRIKTIANVQGTMPFKNNFQICGLTHNRICSNHNNPGPSVGTRRAPHPINLMIPSNRQLISWQTGLSLSIFGYRILSFATQSTINYNRYRVLSVYHSRQSFSSGGREKAAIESTEWGDRERTRSINWSECRYLLRIS